MASQRTAAAEVGKRHAAGTSDTTRVLALISVVALTKSPDRLGANKASCWHWHHGTHLRLFQAILEPPKDKKSASCPRV